MDKQSYNDRLRKYMSNRRLERRNRLIEALGGKCCHCGSTSELEFDHIVPGSSAFRINGRSLDKPWSDLLAEVAKCQLLCRSCHQQKSKECGENIGGWNKGITNQGTIVSTAHGTPSCYALNKCRCAACREAKRRYRAKEITFNGELRSDVLRIQAETGNSYRSSVLAAKHLNRLPCDDMASDSLNVSSPLSITPDLLSFGYKVPVRSSGVDPVVRLCACGNPLPSAHHRYCTHECKIKYGIRKTKEPKPRPSKKPPEQELLYIASGMSLSAAGRFFGVSDNAVRKWLKSFGYDPSNLPRREDLFTFKGNPS